MKKLMFMLLLAGSIQAMYAQKFSPNTPLFEELTEVTSICTSSASKRKEISTTGFLIVTASVSTARTTETI